MWVITLDPHVRSFFDRAQQSPELNDKLKQCQSPAATIDLATRYGFELSERDLQQAAIAATAIPGFSFEKLWFRNLGLLSEVESWDVIYRSDEATLSIGSKYQMFPAKNFGCDSKWRSISTKLKINLTLPTRFLATQIIGDRNAASKVWPENLSIGGQPIYSLLSKMSYILVRLLDCINTV